jgi:hypothetical protein
MFAIMLLNDSIEREKTLPDIQMQTSVITVTDVLPGVFLTRLSFKNRLESVYLSGVESLSSHPLLLRIGNSHDLPDLVIVEVIESEKPKLQIMNNGSDLSKNFPCPLQFLFHLICFHHGYLFSVGCIERCAGEKFGSPKSSSAR